jgi:hypothetical protein
MNDLGFLSGGHSYDVESKTNAKSKYTIRNELFHVGKKLTLLEDGKEIFIVCRLNYLLF